MLGVLTGLTLLTVGYVGSLDSPLSEAVRGLLDGPLAPFRNVHKFEPVLRLPLMLAFVHAVTGRLPGLARAATPVVAMRARLAVGVLLVAVMAAPAWLFTLRPGPGWDEVPGYWRSAMTWLADRGPAAPARCCCRAPGSASTRGAARSTSPRRRSRGRRGRCATRSRSAPRATRG